MPSRRDFIRRTLSIAGLGVAGNLTRFGLAQACPASSGYRALVCVFLFGGNDSNNLIVPMDAANLNGYNTVRKNLALPTSMLLPVQTPGKNPYGFHPRLAEYQKLFANKNLAVVANVGSLVKPLSRPQYLGNQVPVPLNLFSHSDQQMQWQTSIPNGISGTGWAGRVADQVACLNAPSTFPTFVSVSGNALIGAGALTRPGSVVPGAPLGLTGFDNSAASQARENALKQLLTIATGSGAALVGQAANTMSNGLRDTDTLTLALKSARPLSTLFPKTGIGAQLQEIAQLIQVRDALKMNRQIFFCSLGGFDTHTNQLNDQDALFGQLGSALGAFYAATQELNVAQDVTAFTESDFSRTFVPNTNGGTDHAWGSHHIVMGGAVVGGDVYGQFPSMTLNDGIDAGGGRWIPTTAIDQYGATLAQWFGVAPALLPAVFPNLGNFTQPTLPFMMV